MPIDRRSALLGTAALALPLAAPSVLRAQSLRPRTALPATIDSVTERARELEQLHALLVLQDGEPIIEEAFRGPGLDRTANVKSVSKTLLALITGIAIERGHIEGPDAPVLPLLGREPTGDARDELTIGHLLSMQTGLRSTSGPRYGAWVSSNDWIDYVLESELVSEPGGRYIYSTGGWHVLGAVLSRATGRGLHSLASEWLSEPLDIRIPPWERDPQGLFLGGNQMGLTPRHLARVGEMVRQGGAWNGEQVVPENWIEESWTPRARSRWTGDGYGYGWFLTRIDGARAAYGRGYGGQVLAVIPERSMTIVMTSDPNLPARTAGHFGNLIRLMRQIATLERSDA